MSWEMFPLSLYSERVCMRWNYLILQWLYNLSAKPYKPGVFCEWRFLTTDSIYLKVIIQLRICLGIFFFLTELWRAVQFSSVTQLCTTLCDPIQHARLTCPSPTPGAYSNSCPSCEWCHPTISSSVIPFSSRLQSFPASGSFPMSQFFTSGSQNIGVSASASVLPVNIKDWFSLGLTGWISL